ncbi:PAS domain-containing protein [Halomonas sp.]|uniref:PAS domain-containing protein n=1 Tax=Halomonas sp. TaxID=1486246 RepID=UPI002603D2B3|nr:PAS domain-containing protein [Halomonas sp.]
MIRPLLARLRALLPAGRRQDRFFTLSSDLFCRVDLAGRFVEVNPAFRHQLGLDETELLGAPYTRLVEA